MVELEKTINEFKEWENKLVQIIDTKFDKITAIIIAAYGVDKFIPLKHSKNVQQFGPHGFIEEGLVINQFPVTDDKYIWYYKNSIFYLIERANSNLVLNVNPIYDYNNINFQLNAINGQFRFQKAKAINEIDFLISFMENSDNWIKKIKQKKENVVPEEIGNNIDEFSDGI